MGGGYPPEDRTDPIKIRCPVEISIGSKEERRRIGVEDKKVKEQLEIRKQWTRMGKILALEDYIPELVHKLNNHLAPVIGYAQLLLPKMIDPEAKKHLEKIIEETQQASQIIKDIVNFARKRKPKKEVVDLNDLIEAVLEMKTPKLNLRNIGVVKDLSPSIPLTQVDPNQIQQVLLYFTNNAEEAISEFHGFGIIRVKTRVMEGQIEIIISDDGPGIAKENISKIFEPFFTTKGKGIGLGLTISNDILIEHDGTLRVESEWGKGATFIITLPIIKVEGEKERDKGKSVERSLKGRKGLVIDDAPTFLDLVFKYLELEGCEIITALDVKTALNIIEGKDFDFVICDIRMPEMSGIDFYRIVKEKKPFLRDRIIFSTGDVLSDTTKTFINSVTNPHIGKPFNLNELKEVITLILR